ncbi:hypothetical protein K402DRAFT_362682 [Aulographum hederae CBS 113979]|uniref:Pescadillo homolog n=1 Tax=Aulographum hederae CBS 113979 TaxID=1176131 RepID=A0A6G1GP11_9PEZI|nr:hypothetical protein K402DRAFT_362682 [Aulographum hederae CBS 113979]
MTKIKRKGTSGTAKNYVTRTQAVRKLQVSLPDFRRLCIFKGIYPREPRQKKKVGKHAKPNTTFYYTKDIQYLLHEPILGKFRDHKALAKKIGRALGKGELNDAARLEKTHKPRITLDHVIKERYPTFVDALRDLDDALSMLFLFANLPSTEEVPRKTVELCQRLCYEFEHYLIVSKSLRKSFLSIKGVYYQATIQGQDILWVVPYRFVQKTAGDIDFRIMGTFIEFYTTLLGFVNFRLYTTIGLVYPPKFNKASDEKGGELGAFTLEGKAIESLNGHKEIEPATNGHSNGAPAPTSEAAQAIADSLAQNAADEEPATETPQEESDADSEAAIDTFTSTDPTTDILLQPSAQSSSAATLFAPFTFFLSRETPRQPLEFILKAFGCKRVGWDEVLGDGAFVTDESDPSITHQIVDRPQIPLPDIPAYMGAENETDGAVSKPKRLPPGTRIPNRTYVQPQWVWDSINEGKLLRSDLYSPGKTLPPHLSPWAKPKKGEYDPRKPLEEQEEEGEAEVAAEAAEHDEEEADVDNAMASDLESDEEDEEDVDDEIGMDVDLAASEDEISTNYEEDEDEWGGISDADSLPSDTELSRRTHQAELEAEAGGVPSGAAAAGTKLKSALKKPSAADKAKRKQREEAEELERRMMMMPRKKRKLAQAVLGREGRTNEEARKLRGRRRKAEAAKEAAGRL